MGADTLVRTLPVIRTAQLETNDCKINTSLNRGGRERPRRT